MAKKPAVSEDAATGTEIRHRVKINADKGAGGDSNVDLFVNGIRCSLERGKDLLLTAAQLEVLENAEVGGYSMEIAGKMCVSPPTKRYSYNVYGTVEVPKPGASPEVESGPEVPVNPAATSDAKGSGFVAP